VHVFPFSFPIKKYPFLHCKISFPFFAESLKYFIFIFIHVRLYDTGSSCARVACWFLLGKDTLVSHFNGFFFARHLAAASSTLVSVVTHVGRRVTPPSSSSFSSGHLQRRDAFRISKSGHERPFASPRGHILFARPFASGCAPIGATYFFKICNIYRKHRNLVHSNYTK
jgi:hypothetical protein